MKRFRTKPQRGAAVLEYVVALCLIAVAGIVALPRLGSAVSTQFANVGEVLASPVEPRGGSGGGGEEDSGAGGEHVPGADDGDGGGCVGDCG